MQWRFMALIGLLLVTFIGCGRRAETPKPQVAVGPEEKKPTEPDAETLRRREEAAKKAQELKEARAKELAKIQAAQEAEAKAKKQSEDVRRAFLENPTNRADLRGYRKEVENTKESAASIKSLRLRIGELLRSEDPKLETVRADLEDQLREEERRVEESPVKAKKLFAKLRASLPKEMPLTDDQLSQLAFSLPPLPSLDQIQARYERFPVKVLPITEPIDVEQVEFSKDGGSILWLFLDKDGKQHLFRTYQNSNGPFHYSDGSKKEEKGRPLADGGEEQKELYGIWLRWIRENVENADAFLANREPAESDLEPAALGLSFRALERRLVERE